MEFDRTDEAGLDELEGLDLGASPHAPHDRWPGQAGAPPWVDVELDEDDEAALATIANVELASCLLEAAPGPAFVCDAHGVRITSNSAARRVARVLGAELAGLLASRDGATVDSEAGPWRVMRRTFAAGTQTCHLVVLVSTSMVDPHVVLQRAIDVWKPTARQTDVLRGMLEGLSNKEIAHETQLSPRTVEVHVTALFIKAGVTSRARLIAKARELMPAPDAPEAPDSTPRRAGDAHF